MKILAIQLNQPGDAILTTPALRWWINARCVVHVLAQPVSAELLKTMPGLAGVHPLLRETFQIGRDFLRWRQFSKIGFDWAVVFSHSSERPSLWAYLSGAPKRTAIVLNKYPRFLRLSGWITQWTHHPDWAVHVAEEHLALAGAPAADVGQYNLEYTPSDDALQWYAPWLERNRISSGGYIHFHLTSRRQEKCWPVAHARTFIQQVRQELSLPLVVTTGPDHQEQAYAREVLDGSPEVIRELGSLSPHQLGAIIIGATAFVGMDSLPMHLAAAAGIPGVALFGPTDPAKWGPWHSRLKVIQSEGSSHSMGAVPPAAVLGSLREQLDDLKLNTKVREFSS